jgi:hypothetical protein
MVLIGVIQKYVPSKKRLRAHRDEADHWQAHLLLERVAAGLSLIRNGGKGGQGLRGGGDRVVEDAERGGGGPGGRTLPTTLTLALTIINDCVRYR